MDTKSFNIISTRNRLYVWIAIAVTIVVVTILHFLTPTDQIVWHEIYQRLYYIPIIAAALIFGLRGGLAASIFTTIVYSPHVYIHWQHGHFDYSINQYAEIVIFNLVGGIMGALGDRLRMARERAERNAEERRKAFDELQNTFQQLLQAEKLSSLGELSAGIVHEVRNPLASIKGAVEILEDESTEKGARREFADLAIKEIDRLDRLVGEFLRFARPTTPLRAYVDINEIVESVATLVAQQAASQSMTITRELSDNVPPIYVDAEQIRQVLLNLVINGMQAMAASGRGELKLMLRTFEQHGAAIVEVADTGPGVLDENVRKIFDPFFTTKEQGVGLGLSIAYKIASQHGATLSVRRDAAETAFQLVFPPATKTLSG